MRATDMTAQHIILLCYAAGSVLFLIGTLLQW